MKDEAADEDDEPAAPAPTKKAKTAANPRAKKGAAAKKAAAEEVAAGKFQSQPPTRFTRSLSRHQTNYVVLARLPSEAADMPVERLHTDT